MTMNALEQTGRLSDWLNGETRLVPIVGHPTVQVKSPSALTTGFLKRGRGAVCVPIDVEPADFPTAMKALQSVQNLDGMVITVPHKVAAMASCTRLTDRARFIGAVNVMRRGADGGFLGDMCDGEGFVAAARGKGASFEGADVLLIGAGGAGSAIAYAMMQAGANELTIAEVDRRRRDALVAKLKEAGGNAGTFDDQPVNAFSIIVNASPIGMNTTDIPMPLDGICADCLVGDVVTRPEITAFLTAASAQGCQTVTGVDMYEAVAALMLSFLLKDSV